jgi:hypothetical protein
MGRKSQLDEPKKNKANWVWDKQRHIGKKPYFPLITLDIYIHTFYIVILCFGTGLILLTLSEKKGRMCGIG